MKEIKDKLIAMLPTFISGLQQVYTIGNGIPNDKNAMEQMERIKGTLDFVHNFPTLVKPYIKNKELEGTLGMISVLCYKILQGIEQNNLQTFTIAYNTLHSLLSRLNILSKNSFISSLENELKE